MKGHTLPGIKQRPSPAKLFGVDDAIAAAIISAATTAATTAGSAISRAGKKKRQERVEIARRKGTAANFETPGTETKIV